MSNKVTETEVILIGAGIMSATLGTLLKELVPEWDITVFEEMDKSGDESSNVWNNAGKGNSAICELNNTTEKPYGTKDISKAIKVNEQVQESKLVWSYLVKKGLIKNPVEFIRPLPHMSLVH